MLTWNEGHSLPIVLNEDTEGDGVVIRLRVPADLFQFHGHFPQMKVLPGVAQLDWAVLFARSHLGVTGAIVEVTQLKFRTLVTPETILDLHLKHWPEKNRVGFEFKDQNNVYSSGFLKMEVP
jgi:3-hydroxymyristoyl/3-hydroxydecanoyl-(acyl carrier protein) dehydratase